MKPTIRSLILVSVLAVTSQVASAVVIDNFTQGALFIQATNFNGQTLHQDGLSTADVFGGSRSVRFASLGIVTAVIDTSAGQFSFTTSVSSLGYFTLTYSGLQSTTGADLTADENDSFALNIGALSLTVATGIHEFDVETSGSWYTYDFSRDLLALDGPGILTIPFSSFQGANMTQVQAIEINVARFAPSSNIVIESVMTVPEPSVLTILAGGLAAFTFTVRRIANIRIGCAAS
jgi:hypothetical protein